MVAMRDRSRSPRREGTSAVQEVVKSVKEGSSESDIVNVAIKQLPQKIRSRLEKLFEEGLLKDNDLDLRSVTVFASLNEGLQDRVMTHLETERIYVANARSKSGFLIATCDKAKTGCLDARGLGAIDPWRSALVAMATPKQKMFDLEPERDWIEKYGTDAVKIKVNVACVEKELGKKEITVELPLTETSAALKSKLMAEGIKSVPTNKMKIHIEPVGFLKDSLPLAYYNIVDGVEAELHVRQRAGLRYRRDHAVPQKRPKTQDKQSQASNPLEHIKFQQGGGPPAAAPTLPGLDALKAPGGLTSLTASLTAPKAPGLGAAPGLPGLPGLPSLPGVGGLPALPKLGGLPGGFPGLGGLTLPGASAPSLLSGTAPALGLGGLGAPPPALAGLGGLGAPPSKSSGGPPGLPSLGGLPLAPLGGLPPGLTPPPGLSKAGSLPDLPKLGALPGLGAPMSKSAAP